MTACVRSNCPGGVLDEDGMCTTCLRAPESARPLVPHDSGRRCPRGDCADGTLDETGMCDRCQREEPAAGWVPKGHIPRRPAEPPVWWVADSRLVDGTGAGEPLTTPVSSVRDTLDRSKLGLGLVDIPAPPSVSPQARLLADSEIVERERRCPNPGCREPLWDEATGSEPKKGRCAHCSTDFSFRPVLGHHEELGPQYVIEGCIGYGGQGRVYLARDLNLDDEWVAVKGVRGDRDERAMNTLATEKHALIRVRHPDIVDIRNFVARRREGDDDGLDVFIVLEFIAGVSLEEKKQVFPPGEAISYVLAALPALGYLHDSGLVYGDFKPANVMHVGDRVKLIDMGAVRRIGSRVRDELWTTEGFSAPEALDGRPSAATDVYTVGRTLAVLTADFDPKDPRTRHRLPEPGDVPAFAAHESFYRFLLKATAEAPRHRFTSAAQMAEQLSGVLREVVALEEGRDDAGPGSVPSQLFTYERAATGTGTLEEVRTSGVGQVLPLPHPDPDDPAAVSLSALREIAPREAVRDLGALPRSPEVAFRLVVAHLDDSDPGSAREVLDTVAQRDWRYAWYSGLVELAQGAARAAWQRFAAIRDALPGELAPKFALAVCAEAMQEFELARHYYRTVWRTDKAYVSAAFGLARTYLPERDEDPRHRRIEVLETVPREHHRHVEAAQEALWLRLGSPRLDAAGLREAARRLERLSPEPHTSEYLPLRTEVLEAARRLLAEDPRAFGTEDILQVAVDDTAFCEELTRVYLERRRSEPNRRARVALVRKAHATRPWTRW
ncbi:serine/threonine-protein kinase [Streptantibioticus silvisoli]|uniref:non-specific serine/threonine protein kinase n=1 Tax=Streptantibioticus silvisoli TaxID=2705255 RepID=A0ABT6VY02_9ACTN|nr:serine/threonine-protein kinase [Streptantibioticus silvisoli]MDI5963368.1 tetratricopeptide repeat protein [Streptantibioticus silvisoli]